MGEMPIHGKRVHCIGAQAIPGLDRGWSCQVGGGCKITTAKLCECCDEEIFGTWS